LKKNIFIFYLIIISTSLLFCNNINEIIDKYIRFNKWDEAKLSIEIYIKNNNNDSYAYELYSVILKELKMYDESIIALRNAINNEKSNEKKGELYFNIGNLLYDKGQKDIAFEMYQKSLEFNGMLAPTYYMIGLINFESSKIEEAVKNWKRYLVLSTDLEKKKKLEAVLKKIEKDIEDKKIAEQKRLEEEKRKAEEEKKRKEEYEKMLVEEKKKEEERERIRIQEEKRKAEEERKRKEDEEKRLAEEKRKRDEMLNSLKEMLQSEKRDSTSLEEYKIDKKKKDTDLEEIQ